MTLLDIKRVRRNIEWMEKFKSTDLGLYRSNVLRDDHTRPRHIKRPLDKCEISIS